MPLVYLTSTKEEEFGNGSDGLEFICAGSLLCLRRRKNRKSPSKDSIIPFPELTSQEQSPKFSSFSWNSLGKLSLLSSLHHPQSLSIITHSPILSLFSPSSVQQSKGVEGGAEKVASIRETAALIQFFLSPINLWILSFQCLLLQPNQKLKVTRHDSKN